MAQVASAQQFPFVWEGTDKKGKRLNVMEESLATEGTSIFFESPHRLLSTLELLAEKHPTAPCCVARELTKKFETYHRGTAAELAAHFKVHGPKGEIVFLIAGEKQGKRSEEED